MPLTNDYYRYDWSGTCNIVASSSANIAAASAKTCVVGANSLVYAWNLRTAQKTTSLEGGGEKSQVTCVQFSSGRERLAVGAHDGNVRIFDRSARAKRTYRQANGVEDDEDDGNDDAATLVLAGHKSAVACLAFSDDNLMLASGGRDCAIIVWDMVNESGLFKLLGHKNNVTCLRFTRDSKFLISGSKDSLIKFWSLESQSCFYTLSDHVSEVHSFLLLRNDNRLLVGTSEMELRYYELKWFDASAKKDLELGEYSQWAQASNVLACKPLGTLLRASKGRCHQLAVDDTHKIAVVVGTGAVFDVLRLYSADESEKRVRKKLAKARKVHEANETAEPFDAVGMEALIREDLSCELQRVAQHKCDAKVRAVDFAPSTPADREADQRSLMCLLHDNQVACLRLVLKKGGAECETEQLASAIGGLGHRGLVRAMALATDAYTFASGAQDSIKIWHRHSMTCTTTILAPDGVGALAFITGDRHLAVGTKDGALHLLDIVTQTTLESHEDAHEKQITALHQSPDGRCVASASYDKSVRLWQYELRKVDDKQQLTLRHVRTLQLNDEINCVRFTPDGKYIVVGLMDNTAKVFFEDTFKLFLTLYGHSLPVYCVDASTDGKLVVTGSADKNVKLWGLDFGDCHKSLFAHDDCVTQVHFVSKTHNFFTAGKDGKVKHWNGDKFHMIQQMDAHFAPIWQMLITPNGNYCLSAGDDGAIKLWEKTDELIVVEEERQNAREREHEEALLERDEDDIVPGEPLAKRPNDGESAARAEVSVASRRTLHGIQSAEEIIEAVDVWRQRREERRETGKEPETHVLMQVHGSTTEDRLVVDVLARVRSADMHKSLLMVPYSYVLDILHAIIACLEENYKVELCARVAVFLQSIHQNQITGDAQALPVVDRLRIVLPKRLNRVRDTIGFNLAALELLRLEIEQRNDVQLFMEAHEKAKKKKKKQSDKLEQAYVMTLTT